ncbi:MAG: sodium:proton antiporter [Sphingobacteriales bacterium]|nr:MAG: sodium:proton antiporter [Sphingobacteriales bacterium]
MNHLPPLIHDLGLILILAGITTLIFKKLKQPLVLGYLLAGLLVGPNFHLFPTVTDAENIRIWADIGVIFLLFTLGLEFSFKKLMHIGGTSSITAIIEVAIMLGVGFSLGRIMGWATMDSMFLGGILSVASTTIIIRSFDELNVKSKRFANLVFGVLIIEDLVAILLMVLLSTIAVSQNVAGGDLLLSVLKLVFFLILWFIGGILFIPTFLRWTKKLMNDETMLVVSIGLCLTMVILASMAGFSPALGAFIMGSILAETTQAERIEHLIKPVKDLFGAVFFISVGMLIDPTVLVDYAVPVLVITVVFILFKVMAVTIGALIAGQPLKTAIYAGMSMGQIGEFSFIIATLGLTLNVTSSFLYPIAVAVSAITTFSTPYMIKMASPLYNVIEAALPIRWKKTLARYSSGTGSITNISDWRSLLRTYAVYISLFSIVIIGIIVLFAEYAGPWLMGQFKDPDTGNFIAAALCFLVLAPLLWALIVRKIQPDAFANLWVNKRYRGPLLFLRLVRAGLGIVYVSIFLLSFFPFKYAIAGVLGLIAMAIIFSKRIHAFYIRLEDRFLYNFNQREIHEAETSRHELAPWDAHIVQFVLPDNSPVTARPLIELGLREKFGVNIAMIKRASYTIYAPQRNEKLYPGDKLFVIGTDEEIEGLRKHVEPQTVDGQEIHQDVVLQKITVRNDSYLLGMTIRESGIREKTNGIVVGIERNARRMLNPESGTTFEEGDRVWIVGEGNLIEQVIA